MKILIIIILPVIYTYKTRRNLKKNEKNIKEGWNKIDGLLKVRNDIIPDLLEIVKDYINSNETINNINETRDNLLSAKTKKDKMEKANKLSYELEILFSVTEDYSDLKDNSKFLDIQNMIHDTEDQIIKTRNNYNKNAKKYKKQIKGFPSNIVAYMFKFKPVEIFSETKPEVEKIEVLKL